MLVEKAQVFRAELLDDLLFFRADYRKFQFSHHSHDEFALGVMERGVQKFWYQGEHVYADEGDIITVNAGELHNGMSANGENYKYWIVYIPDDLFQDVGKNMVSSKKTHCFAGPVVRDRALSICFREAVRSVEESVENSMEVQSAFYSALAKLLCSYGMEKPTHESCSACSAAVSRACEYINDMASENISLDDIAGEACLSKFHFLRKFSKEIGIPPHSYLIYRRLGLAKEAMSKGLSISDAAVSAGFSDQSHLTRKFKSAYGITPLQFKKIIR